MALPSLLKPSKKLSKRLTTSSAFWAISDRLHLLNEIGANLGWPTIVREANRIDHVAARGKRGRVPRTLPLSSRKIVIDKKSIEQYSEETWRHLGQSKSGWRLAALALGVPARDFQHWISRQKTVPGVWIDRNRPDNSVKTITIGNQVRWRYDFYIHRILSSAMNHARITMEKQIQIIAKKQKEAWERRKSARPVQGGLRVGRFGGPTISYSPRIFTGEIP